MAKTGRNDPCPCGSGEKHKRCCGDPLKLRMFVYDHPALSDLMETRAKDMDSARVSFRAEWDRRRAAGKLPNGASFASGRIRLDGGGRYQVGFRCPKKWDELKLTGSESVRFCDGCKRDVHFVTDEAALRECVKKNECVAIVGELVDELTDAPCVEGPVFEQPCVVARARPRIPEGFRGRVTMLPTFRRDGEPARPEGVPITPGSSVVVPPRPPASENFRMPEMLGRVTIDEPLEPPGPPEGAP